MHRSLLSGEEDSMLWHRARMFKARGVSGKITLMGMTGDQAQGATGVSVLLSHPEIICSGPQEQLLNLAEF